MTMHVLLCLASAPRVSEIHRDPAESSDYVRRNSPFLHRND